MNGESSRLPDPAGTAEGSGVSVTLLANAGVLLRAGDTGLLVDGLFDGAGHPFSALSPRGEAALFAGEPPFAAVDYLLFTHAHPDHFSPERTMAYLRRRGVRGVLMPACPRIGESDLDVFLRERGIPCAVLPEGTHGATFSLARGVTVTARRTLHLDRRFRGMAHFCYLIAFGGKRVLFTGDADYTREEFRDLEGLSAAFVNPLFFGALGRGRFFRGHFDTERFCVYHVPFAGEDPLGYRPRLRKDLALWPKELPPPVVLDREGQTVWL